MFLLTASLYGQTRESLLKALHTNPEWSAIAEPAAYTLPEVEKFAGKQAVAIRHYGFVGADVQDWKGTDGRVHLTVYQMTDPSAAYGLFTFQRAAERTSDAADSTSVPMGSEGFHRGTEAYFWQSKFVVKLEGDTKAVDSFGQWVSKNIFGQSIKPPVSELLPPNNLIRGSERYVIDAQEVDHKLGLDTSLLGFDDEVEMATANYRIDGKTTNLVLLLYPTQQVAKKYAEGLDAKLPNETGSRKRVGALIALVRGPQEATSAKQLLDLVNYETQVTWNEPRPDLTMSQIVLTAFTFIGIALLFTAVVGLSFGGVRIFMKAQFPNRVFDRREEMEVIQLNLIQGVTDKKLIE